MIFIFISAAVAFVIAPQSGGVGSQESAVLSAPANFHSALLIYVHIYVAFFFLFPYALVEFFPYNKLYADNVILTDWYISTFKLVTFNLLFSNAH